jgi:hypothetical protein
MIAAPKFDPSAFADDFDIEPVKKTAVQRGTRVTAVPTVQQKVSSRPAGKPGSAFLTKPPTAWDWRDLRDYCVTKILQMHPALLPKREEAKEFGIFSAFHGRHGELAGLIAKFAFEGQSAPGMWMGAPIGIGRFAKASDPSFADIIKHEHLTQS